MAIGIDIGSNSLRVVQIDCTHLKKTAEFEKVVRTAEKIEESGTISKEAVQRIVAALLEAKETIDFHDRYKAVATAAFRKAKNAKEVVQEIFEKTGIQIDIIDAQLESFYSAKGVEFGLLQAGIEAQKFLIADIGGGSTEIILKQRSGIVFESFPLGILTTIQKYTTKEAIVFGIKKEIARIKEYLCDIFEIFGKPKIFVGTGGTPATVAALKLGMDANSYDARRVSGATIDREDIEKAYRRLIILEPKKRAALVGTGREDAIIAGLVILEEILRVANYKEMVVVDEGVREGVALEICTNIKK